MDEILCLEKIESTDVKYHITVAFSRSKSYMTIVFPGSSLKISKKGIFSAKALSTYMKLCMNLIYDLKNKVTI